MDEKKNAGVKFSIEITKESWGDRRIGAGEILKATVPGLGKGIYQGEIVSIDFSDDDVVKLIAIDREA